MPLVETKSPRQLSDGNTAGTQLGAATNSLGLPDNIGFYGKTPVPQLLQGALAGTNGVFNLYLTATVSAASVASHSTAEQQFTATGVATTDMVIGVSKPTTDAGLLVGTARVSATNTVQVTLGNDTGANVTPTATQSWLIWTVPAGMQLSAALTPASVAAGAIVEQQFTVPGIQPGMMVAVTKPTLQAGLMITNVRAITTNTVGITFANLTTGTVITPTAAETYLFFAGQGLRVAPTMYNIVQTLTPVSVAANTTAEQTFTVPGLTASDAVSINKPSVTTGLTVAGVRISAVNTLAVNFANNTAAAITPPAEAYTISFFSVTPPSAGSVTATAAVLGVDASNEMNRLGLTA